MREVVEARRFLAGELSSAYRLMRNVSIGAYYLYSHGFEASAPDNIHYISLNTRHAGIGLSNGFLFSLSPQVYYLTIDQSDGIHFTLRRTPSNRSTPLTTASIINTPFQPNISGGSDLLWNVSLIYSFDLVD